MESLHRMMLRERWKRLIQTEEYELSQLSSLADDFLKYGLVELSKVMSEIQAKRREELKEKNKLYEVILKWYHGGKRT